MKIAIIIPFYNEEQNLHYFLKEWNNFLKSLRKKKYVLNFFFINDGSTDYSVEIIKKNSDKYEYILPNILYGKTFFSENFGALDLKTNAFYSNYNTNKHKTFLTNDIIWSPLNYITKKGFVNTLGGMVRNINYETKNTEI